MDDGKQIKLALGGMEHSLGLTLRVAQLTSFKMLFDVLDDSSPKVGEFSVLKAIADNPGVRQGVLADVFKIKWPSMSKMINKMEKKGYLVRVVPPNDRRSVTLKITELGKVEAERFLPMLVEANDKVFSMLDDGEQATLLKLLRKISGWS